MSDLPEGWTLVTAADAGSISLGRQRSPKNHTGSNMRPYLRVANVFEDRIDASDVMEMHFEPDEFERYRLVPGDVLLNEGQSPALLGRPAIYRGDPADVAFTNSLIRFKANPGILPEWALIVFRHHMHSGRFSRESRITTNIAHLSATRFAATEFPIPPFAEQARIVAELERRLSHVAAALAGLDRVIQRIRVTRDSILLQAATGRTGHFDDSGLPLLAHGWEWTTLGECADVVGGVTKDSKKQSHPEYVEVPYLRVANVQQGYLDLSEVATIRVAPEKAESLRLRSGDVLFNEGGDRDKLGRGWVWNEEIPNCIHQNHVFRARLTEGRLDPRFVSWCGNSYGRKWFEHAGRQTTNLASISLSTLKSFPVPLPIDGALPAIIAETERRLSLLAAAEDSVNASRARAKELQRSLLQVAFTGRLVPQDPDEEPASELVARMDSERERVAASNRSVARRRTTKEIVA